MEDGERAGGEIVRAQERKLFPIFAIRNLSLLERAGTEHVRQLICASITVRKYAASDILVQELFSVCSGEKYHRISERHYVPAQHSHGLSTEKALTKTVWTTTKAMSFFDGSAHVSQYTEDERLQGKRQ